MHRIAIIGAGYSGTAAAIHLSRLSPRKLQISLIDARDPGAGLAHSTRHPDHRLNGPDGNHLLYPDRPSHFADWLRASGALSLDPEAIADSGLVFARRGDFGSYMGLELATHARTNASDSTIDHVHGRAIRLMITAAGTWEILMEDDLRVPADVCILATGWDGPSVPSVLTAISDHPGWVADPWNEAELSRIPSGSPTLLIGAGLTASDVFAALTRQGHRAPVFALSRHGLRPVSQNPHPRPGSSFWDAIVDPVPAFIRRHGYPDSISSVVRALRADIARLNGCQSSWHTPFDEVRDASLAFWRDLPIGEKRRFLRHVKPWYDVHRFRNPPQTEQIVEEGRRRGQLSFFSGHLRDARKHGAALVVEMADRADGRIRSFRVGHAINCTGPQLRPSESRNPLIRNLVADGLLVDSGCGMGVEVDSACRAIGSDGHANPTLAVIGPPTSGCFGETTAVPFITRQITRIASTLTAASAGNR